MSSSSKKSSGPLWSRNIAFRGDDIILINKQAGKILCWAQPIGDGKCNWIPVAFKTQEAADSFLASGSVEELRRIINAPVEWQNTLIGTMPAMPTPLNQGISTLQVAGSPQTTPPAQPQAAPVSQPPVMAGQM